jgi:mRNA interferase HigB
MHVIAKRTLKRFCQTLPKGEQRSAEVAMDGWHAEAEAASWANFAEIKATFNTADWVGDGKVVFDVGGNKYRIVGLIGFRSKTIYVLFVGTHKQYDAIDVTEL